MNKNSIIPFSGQDRNLFHVWVSWLHELGGKYTALRDLTEQKPRTGRRDADIKPRQYELGTHQPDRQYGVRTSGAIVRL